MRAKGNAVDALDCETVSHWRRKFNTSYCYSANWIEIQSSTSLPVSFSVSSKKLRDVAVVERDDRRQLESSNEWWNEEFVANKEGVP